MSQFELRLDRFALVSLSKYLWQHEQTQAEIFQIFTSKNVNTEESKDDQDVLMEKVIEWAKKILPSNLNKTMLDQLQKKLLYVVKAMGKAIFSWLTEVNLKLKVSNDDNQKEAVKVYLNNIIWNEVGMIDWSKTIRTMIDQKKFPNSYMKYVELCFNCLEDDIDNWYKKTPIDEIENINNLIRQHYHQRYQECGVSWDKDDLYFFVYWHYRCQKNSANFKTRELIKYFSSYFEKDNDAISTLPMSFNKYLSVDANMFVLCALNYKHLGLVYFWERMDEKSRKLVFVHGFKIFKYIPYFRSEWLMESSIFMLNNVPHNLAREFINHIFTNSIPHGLSDSPWIDVSPEIHKLLQFFKLHEMYKLFKMMLECGFIAIDSTENADNIKRQLNDTFQNTPHVFAEVFDYTIAKCILDLRDFSFYTDIIQHEAFEKIRFKIAVEFPIQYFGEIHEDDDFMELFKTYVQEILTENEKREFGPIWRQMSNGENSEMNVDE